ncbi:DUF4249 domain-containing protein [Gramella sp. BOM4]|nr:DUF4249 domain-containing protein [Christiangramia bathymodioli]
MKRKKIKARYRNFLSLGILFLLMACVESYDFKSEGTASVIIVQGFVSDEFKRHEISLSNSYDLESDENSFITNAAVSVIASDGAQYDYFHTENGVYKSYDEFQAEAGKTYQLEILHEGVTYLSEEEKIYGRSEIGEVEASLRVNNAGIEGIAITTERSSNEDQVQFFRYDYSETYKIVAPYSSGYKLVVDPDGQNASLVEAPDERRVCYNTEESIESVLKTTKFREDQTEFEDVIRFLPVNDLKIRYRYSILLKQYLISPDAYNFYETLKELSGSQNAFSQNQPGFITGNIKAVNSNNKVLGYFEVASADEKRIFVDPLEFFNVTDFPGFDQYCSLVWPGVPMRPNSPDPLVGYIESGEYQYVGDRNSPYAAMIDLPPDTPVGPYILANISCVDCRTLGTNVQPEFWIEDE